ncbi:hypothetical protein ACFQE8_03030 [Salinirubellus sp. GCM10025818]|uniref:hypothetical protein n=1 Tax=Salinirubellus TaxID=2162630 RepID=UPI0030D1FE39
MATCQGNHPITTKVDEQTRVLIDESADEIGVSRSELLRRLLNLYHQSENGELECPACSKTARIQLDDETSGFHISSDPSARERADGGTDVVSAHDTADGANTDDSASAGELESRVTELESLLERQQDELEYLREELHTEREVIDDHEVSKVSYEDLSALEEQLEQVSTHARQVAPRIEALTSVSDLSRSGSCPRCGGELTVDQSFTDLGDSSAINCPECGLIVGYRG